MANPDPMEAEGLQPTRPSTPEANKKPAAAHDTMFSFGSEDDALFADINLECYNDLPYVFIFPTSRVIAVIIISTYLPLSHLETLLF